MSKYDDILNYDYQGPRFHEHMPEEKRAGQFAPFAALRGFDSEIAETRRYTESAPELDESRREELDRILRTALERKAERPRLVVTCFEPDRRKAGGAYVRYEGVLVKADELGGRLIFRDGTALPLNRVCDLELLPPAEDGEEE